MRASALEHEGFVANCLLLNRTLRLKRFSGQSQLSSGSDEVKLLTFHDTGVALNLGAADRFRSLSAWRRLPAFGTSQVESETRKGNSCNRSNSRTRRRTDSGRLLVALALLISFCTTLVAGVVAIAGPAGAVTCSGDNWTNTAGGSWDTGTNWSAHAPPTGTTAACITAPGTYTVTIGNETVSAGALTVGGSGQLPH